MTASPTPAPPRLRLEIPRDGPGKRLSAKEKLGLIEKLA